MSEELNQFPGEKMAIPVGGAHEQMDDSHHTDENPGYVSIKTKGPGKPIKLRLNGKVQTLSQFIQANTSRPVVSDEHFQNYFQQSESENGLVEHVEDFLDKKTGNPVTLESVPSESVRNTDYEERVDPEQIARKVAAKINNQPEQSENRSAQLNSEFTCQSEVYSIAPKVGCDRPEIPDSPAKTKYSLSKKGTKKSVGARKKGQGKDKSALRLVDRPAPYKWINHLLTEILNSQGYCVDIDGRKHLMKVSLVPVEENELESSMEQDDPNAEHGSANINNVLGEGSIDRPPDARYSLEQDQDQRSAVYHVASTQPSTNISYNESNIFNKTGSAASVMGMVSAPNNYGNACDQPLDLTVVKPLDLSVKEKSTSNFREECSFLEQESEDDNGLELSNLDCASSNLQAEANVTEYRTRCPSVASIYERESGLGDEPFDIDLVSDQSGNYSEQNNISDGNLPSLGKLTLDCNSKQEAVLQTSAVQDSAVKQEIEESSERQESCQNGQQYILGLLASRQVTLQQLVELHLKNQQRKSANTPQNTANIPSVNLEANIPSVNLETSDFQQPLQPRVVTSQDGNADNLQDIPAPAMPNLHSLELANTEGGIFETQEERLRNRLKEKIIQRQQTDENA